MNITFKVALAASFTLWMLCVASAFAADTDISQWPHVAPIPVSAKPAQGLVEITLPPELFAAARPDLADLRLTAPSGQPIPYVLRVDHPAEQHPVSYSAKLSNPTFLPNKQSTVTVDFGNRATRTRIDIDTPGTNFRRKVLIEASQDNTSWQILCQTAWLFRIAYDTGAYSKNDIALPDNDFRYLRITVFNAPDDPEQIPIQQVQAWYIEPNQPPETVDVPVRAATTTNVSKQNMTQIEADLGYENLPLENATLSFQDANFLRRIEILGRNRRTYTITESVENSQPRQRQVEEPWTSITGGTVYRLPTDKNQLPSENLTLPLSGQFRYLLVRIYNGDDTPLHFTTLKVNRLQHYLAFQPQTPGTYLLYSGNPDASASQYDLENFADRLRAQGTTPATLRTISPNPLFALPTKTIPWTERYSWLLWTTLIAVLAVLAALVFRQARNIRQK